MKYCKDCENFYILDCGKYDSSKIGGCLQSIFYVSPNDETCHNFKEKNMKAKDNDLLYWRFHQYCRKINSWLRKSNPLKGKDIKLFI